MFKLTLAKGRWYNHERRVSTHLQLNEYTNKLIHSDCPLLVASTSLIPIQLCQIHFVVNSHDIPSVSAIQLAIQFKISLEIGLSLALENMVRQRGMVKGLD